MSNGYDKFFKTARKTKSRSAKRVGVPSVKSPKRKNLRRTKRNKASLVKSLMGLLVFLALTLVGAVYYDEIEAFASRVEVSLIGGAHAESEIIRSEKSTEESAKAAETKEGETREEQLLRRGWTQEEIALFNKLDKRRVELDEKEKRLKELERELQSKQVQLDKRMKELEKIRQGISNQLEEKVKHDQERVSKLVDFYSNMKPQNAAKVIAELDEDLAVEVLANMKKKSAADILNLIESEKAQRLSERFAGYRKN